jgi:hypothetical protein
VCSCHTILEAAVGTVCRASLTATARGILSVSLLAGWARVTCKWTQAESSEFVCVCVCVCEVRAKKQGESFEAENCLGQRMCSFFHSIKFELLRVFKKKT